MNVCLVYDCFYPYTVGGAERWYRNVGERLSSAGHDVTYLTLRQWDGRRELEEAGMRVIAVGPRMHLYARGRRRILPPLVFGIGVLVHLMRHGGRYAVVHTASFPYFSLLAAALGRKLHGFRLLVDWHELWTRGYWQEYLGRVMGLVGWRVQRACARTPHRAFCFSNLHARRLREEGHTGPITVLTGEYAGPVDVRPDLVREPDPVIVYAGRHIPEKRVPAIVPAVALARSRIPELRAEIYGDGPERPVVEQLVRDYGLESAVSVMGFVDGDAVTAALRRALCMVLPSRREGYGLVVVEAAAQGTPSIVVDDPDNAATELIDDGENGVVASSDAPEDIAAAIMRIHLAGPSLRASTAGWFVRNADRLSLGTSLDTVARSYVGGDT